MDTRRKVCDGIKSTDTTNAGLWLDKYMLSQEQRGSQKQPKQELVRQVAGISEPPSYAPFYKRWKDTLNAVGASTYPAKVEGRMVVGLGDAGVLETAITLHHTYGVPYIPGSALKGLAAGFANRRLEDPQWRKPPSVKDAGDTTGDAHAVLFGKPVTTITKPDGTVTTSNAKAGYVTFFDALYVPGSGVGNRALHPDVMAIHHRDYYRGGSPTPPADWDSPGPVPFLSATGSYLIALAGPIDWVSAAFDILRLALEQEGIGAKTSSGYGRLRLNMPAGATPAATGTTSGGVTASNPVQARDLDQEKVHGLINRIQSLPSKDVAGQIERFAQEWQRLQVRTELKRQVAQAILDRVEQANRTKQSKDKAWYQELAASLQEQGAE